MPAYRRRRWREAMTVRIDVNGLRGVGGGAGGLSPAQLERLEPTLAQVREALRERRARGALAFAELPYASDGVSAVRAAAEETAAAFDTLVVLGIGGSSQAGRLLVQALGREGGMRVLVSDSIDPGTVRNLLATLELERTAFNVVSTSGNTAETVARYLIVRDRLLRERGAVDYKRHLVVSTDVRRGALRQIVNDEGFRALDLPGDVDARFGVLGPAGLFPAACAGVDVDELLAGAAYADERMTRVAAPSADPALALAGMLLALATVAGKRAVVVMPYADRLEALADWFCECWNASLGKAGGGDGQAVAEGPTAVRARGSADQHSHLQRYLDGPADATVLFLRVEDHGEAVDIPAGYQDLEEVGCLGGNALGTLLNGQQRVTELALGRRGRPSATVVLPALNAFTIGQVVYVLEWSAVAAAVLAGVEPFGQPAVDDLKQFTYGLLGRPGFEARRAEVEAWVAAKDPAFVL